MTRYKFVRFMMQAKRFGDVASVLACLVVGTSVHGHVSSGFVCAKGDNIRVGDFWPRQENARL